MDIREITIELKKLNNSKSLKAFADVSFSTSHGEITLKGFRVIQKDENPMWIAFPSSSYKNKEGNMVNAPFLEVSKAFKKELTDLILKEYSKT